jgi:threonine dehydrogenase-like Zn-dependent dehydrogenase
MKDKQGRAFVVEGPEAYTLRSYPLPAVSQDDALLEVLVSGVDGSDVKYFKGQVAHRRNFPMIGGDEVVGRIARIGAVASKRWQVAEGDIVVVEPHLGCGLCEECRRGFSRFCIEHKGYGARFSCANPPHFLGGFAEYMYLFPTTKLAPIGDLDPEVAVLIPSMLANGTQWACEVGRVQPGDAVVVLGCGQQGLGCTLAASEAGATKIIVVGLNGDELRFDAARRLGATHVVNATREPVRDFVKDETRGKGVDVVIDVTGSASTPDLAVDVVRTRGRVVHAGLSGKESTMALDRLAWREIGILGSYSHSADSFDRAVALARRRADDLSSVISQRLPLDRTADSIALLESPANRPTKVVILPHMENKGGEAAHG